MIFRIHFLLWNANVKCKYKNIQLVCRITEITVYILYLIPYICIFLPEHWKCKNWLDYFLFHFLLYTHSINTLWKPMASMKCWPCTCFESWRTPVLGLLEGCAHAAAGTLYAERVARNNGHMYICSCSIPLSLWTYL